MELLNEKEAAVMLNCSIYKMQKDRRVGSPIPYMKIGRSVRYMKSDIEKYIMDRKFVSTSDY